MTDFTPNEEKLLKIVQKAKGKKLSSVQIAAKRYPNVDTRPAYARQSVVCVLNKLVRKTKRNKKAAGFVLCKSDRAGPHPNQYWVE